jgi:hypothetical protein
MMQKETDEEIKVHMVEHLMIRDNDSGEVLLNQRLMQSKQEDK